MSSSPRQKWLLLTLLIVVVVQLWFAYGREYFRAREAHKAYIAGLVAQDAKRREEIMQQAGVSRAVLIAGQVSDTPSSADRIEQVAIGGYDHPIAITCTTAQGKQVPCPDSVYRTHVVEMPLWAALNGNSVITLERLYTQLCSGTERFADGMWYLSKLSAAYKYALGTDKWPSQLAKIKAWQKGMPSSEAALYAEAIYWYHYAWQARGNGYASTVAKEGWELFRQREAQAMAALDRIGERNFACAAPYALKLWLMTEQGASDSEIDAVFQRAIAHFPGFHDLYFARARSLSPKWGGSAEQYEAFANAMAARTRDLEGMGMYARLYWLEDGENGALPFQNDPAVPPTWEKLRAGFEDLMQRYPGSVHNLSKYLDVTCRTDAHDLYKKLRSRLAGYEEYIETEDPLDVCDRRHGWTEVY